MNYLQENIHYLSSALSSIGVENAVISPGSRNAPLTVALVRNPYIKCSSVVDERSAGFVGLGMAKASGKPVVLCCTSGTALLNYYPAIAEAFYTGVPLIVLSADRPPELIDNWDGQCIRQEMVFDNHIVASFSIPTYTDEEDCTQEIEEIIQAALTAAIENNGPVHINVPMREPLYGEMPSDFGWEKGGDVIPNRVKDVEVADYSGFGKVLIVNGAAYKQDKEVEKKLKEIIEQEKAVVLNDIISNKNTETVKGYDALLLNAETDVFQPDLLITTGKFLLSKSLKTYLLKHKPVKHLHLCKMDLDIGDPLDTDPLIIEGDVAVNLGRIVDGLNCEKDFIQYWHSQDKEHRNKIETFFKNEAFSEFKACAQIAGLLEEDTILHLANSTTIRYFSYLKPLLKTKQIHSNRGTSGIDGCTSTAVGMALPNGKHVLVTGDIAFLYDINALWNSNFPSNLKIIVLNNGGGGIFRYINGPNKLEELEEFFETAHTRTAAHSAKEYGIEYLSVNGMQDLEEKYTDFRTSEKNVILEIFTDKYENEKQYKRFIEL